MINSQISNSDLSDDTWIQNIQCVPLYDYKKVYFYAKQDHSKFKSGTAVLSQTLGKLVVIDIDNKVKSTYSDQQKQFKKLRNMFVPKDTTNVYIETTANLGLHIFLINDLINDTMISQLPQNRYIEILKKKYYEQGFDIDAFIPCSLSDMSQLDIAKPHKDGLYYDQQIQNEDGEKTALHIPILNRTDTKPTRLRNKFNNIVEMQIISKCKNYTLSTITLTQYLDWVFQNTTIDVKTYLLNYLDQIRLSNVAPTSANSTSASSTQNENDKKKKSSKSQQVQQKTIVRNDIKYGQVIIEQYTSLIVGLLTNAQIHNYSGCNIKTEISLLPVFRSIMFLPEQYWQDVVDKVYQVALLTQKAQKNYYSTWERVKKSQQPFNDLTILLTMTKANAPEQYNQYEEIAQKIYDTALHPYDPNQLIESRVNCIDFSEEIEAGEVLDSLNYLSSYISIQDWFADLQKVMIYNTSDHTFYEKVKDEDTDYYCLQPLTISEIKQIFLDDQINGINMVTYFLKNRRYLNYRGIKIYTTDPHKFSIFKHFQYKPVQNDDLIKLYLEHIEKIICKNDKQLYNYVLNLFAFYFQHPISRSGVGLVIIGPQGSGKNTLTSPLVKLLGQFGKEVNDIDNVLGQFNPILEATHLLVCNEMTQTEQYSTKRTNFDKLKSLITDSTIQINQKNEKLRTVQNITNFIILSNHNCPVILEKGNRRYCVIQTDQRQTKEYYQQLYKSFTAEGFYEALMHFLMTRDISQFNPEFDMPLTKETKELIELNMSTTELFIIKSQIRRIENFPKLRENYKMFMNLYFGDHKKIASQPTFISEAKQFYEQKKSGQKRWLQLKAQYIQEKDENYEYVQYLGVPYQDLQQEIETSTSHSSFIE